MRLIPIKLCAAIGKALEAGDERLVFGMSALTEEEILVVEGKSS